MKSRRLLSTLLLTCSVAMPAVTQADDAHHPDKAKPPAVGQSKAPAEQTVRKMQGNVKKMQAQLDQLGKTRNEAEFQKLLGEHMRTMQENMMLSRGMSGMDCAMMGGGMHGMMGGEGTHGRAMLERMEQIERRMERLEQPGRPAADR